MLIIAVVAFLSLSRANPILHTPKTSSSSLLISRAVPEGQLCGEDPWDGRFCDLGAGTFAWVDRCLDGNADPYFVDGGCEVGENCFERVDADGDDIIDCIIIPGTPERKDVVSTKTRLGKRKFSALNVQQLGRQVSVKLKEDIPEASVSGYAMG
jgi:hypothetical protein